MAGFEVTMHYPDRSYDEHRKFLGSVAGSLASGLDGFRRQGTGVALTFCVSGPDDVDLAVKLAQQRAAGLWPNDMPTTTTVTAMQDEGP